MKPDYSWKALSRPGDAINYFDLIDPSPLQINKNSFNLSNAWWLAELSRLSYHPHFYKENNINLGCLDYDIIGSIDNNKTSTHVTLIKLNQDVPCLVIVFRGSDDIGNWKINAHAYQQMFGDLGKVHNGFKTAYLSIKNELNNYIKENSLPIFVTGHSLGAALAILTTSELATSTNFDSCYTYGSPRVGNPDFINANKRNRIYRIVNNCDVVTTIPTDFASMTYQHIGTPYLISDTGALLEDMNEDEIYTYQKDRLHELKEYTKLKLLNKSIKSIKDDLPSFLADHSPINYVIALQALIAD
jgi:triacylglycerol lipase